MKSRLDETFAAGLQKLQSATGEQLANHTIHHRGQLTLYLRPMGAKVPSIYGESYDAAQDRLAREGKAK